MTDEVKKLIPALREDAEWAEANEWETPITLSDNLKAAADLIESLAAELEKVKDERDGLNIILTQIQAMLETRTRERDRHEIVKSCENCTQYEQLQNPNGNIEKCRSCKGFSNRQWHGVKEES